MFNKDWLWSALSKLKPSPKKGEYYLTDIPALALEAQTHSVQTFSAPFEEVLGINDRVQLAEADAILRQRILRQHMINGVTITDPATTYISALAQIAPDTVIEPNTYIKGNCSIGSSCIIGPNTILVDMTLGDNCKVLASMLENSQLENNVEIGPYSHVRPGCYLEEGVHLGNYAEVNRSRLGSHTQQHHVSYIGDATVGKEVNVGAGTITANYDGKNKNKTIIGDNVFLGCDTILRAPLNLGEQSATGAGSVVTRDVPSGVTVVGVPAQAIKRKPLNENYKED
jgi:bifunctional UDP-N-acetylglucosamine pyrophosphorylase/glucosamine-1-phosphate N-acetyltransferase